MWIVINSIVSAFSLGLFRRWWIYQHWYRHSLDWIMSMYGFCSQVLFKLLSCCLIFIILLHLFVEYFCLFLWSCFFTFIAFTINEVIVLLFSWLLISCKSSKDVVFYMYFNQFMFFCSLTEVKSSSYHFTSDNIRIINIYLRTVHVMVSNNFSLIWNLLSLFQLLFSW